MQMRPSLNPQTRGTHMKPRAIAPPRVFYQQIDPEKEQHLLQVSLEDFFFYFLNPTTRSFKNIWEAFLLMEQVLISSCHLLFFLELCLTLQYYVNVEPGCNNP